MDGAVNFQRLIERAAARHIPLEVALELTHRCNFRCRHCYVPDHRSPDQLSSERIFALLDELVEMGTLYLVLTGGEVLLREDWEDIARHARALGFSIALLTNGALVDERVADVLAELGAHVKVSFYADDPESFEEITGIPGSFAATVAGIRRLKDRAVDLELGIPVMALNRESYRGAIHHARELGIAWTALPKILARKDGGKQPIALRMEEDDLVKFFSGSTCSDGESFPDESSGALCAAGVRFANITPAGDVLACNIMPVVAGNIRESSFREVWNDSPWLQRLRSIRRSDLKECDTCKWFADCGRCPAQALVEDGDLLGPSRDACEHIRARDAAAKRRGG